MEIIARITADAVVKTTKNEKQVVNFNVAINDSYKPKGSDQLIKTTNYVQCAYWVNPGIAQYLTKGTLVELYGRIGVNAYNTLQGEAKASLTFHVNNIKLHGGNKPTAKPVETFAPVIAGELTEPLDDLPF
ncbi:single-strand DNA-binding protein [Hydrobacter penzbergensis]|uniref:Single-strand DNA-binding protein n=1 Tax=Hydrobacter penzbergensis TaxID=1235997 RepID=A0A8X8IEJ6_9BACT|nr:single-stranded DNA-binding protein [Hydrobacter penzbergensis]SDW46135.1 single-strand DNA-binding protein [Hydrobacter penzbergensis]